MKLKVWTCNDDLICCDVEDIGPSPDKDKYNTTAFSAPNGAYYIIHNKETGKIAGSHFGKHKFDKKTAKEEFLKHLDPFQRAQLELEERKQNENPDT